MDTNTEQPEKKTWVECVECGTFRRTWEMKGDDQVCETCRHEREEAYDEHDRRRRLIHD